MRGEPQLKTDTRFSVFEQIIKRGARIIRTLAAFARGLFFYHHSDGIDRAVVLLILGRDSRGDGLIAFEAAGGIEMFALFAGVEIESALRTLADGIGEILQQRSAFRAARDGARARHVDRPRSKGVFFFRSGRRLLEFFFRSPAGVLVSTLPILAIGQKCLLKNAFIVPLWSAAHKRFFGGCSASV